MTTLGKDYLYYNGSWKNSGWIRQYIRQIITDGPTAVEDEFLFILKYTSAEFIRELRTTYELFYEEVVKERPIEYVEQVNPPPLVIYALAYPVNCQIHLN
jgi:hypothetical protein